MLVVFLSQFSSLSKCLFPSKHKEIGQQRARKRPSDSYEGTDQGPSVGGNGARYTLVEGPRAQKGQHQKENERGATMIRATYGQSICAYAIINPGGIALLHPGRIWGRRHDLRVSH